MDKAMCSAFYKTAPNFQVLTKMSDNSKNTDNSKALHIGSVVYSTSDEPENCTKEYNEEVCGECEFRKFEMVGHPGGSSYHSTERYWCDWGHWKDDF